LLACKEEVSKGNANLGSFIANLVFNDDRTVAGVSYIATMHVCTLLNSRSVS